MVKLDLEGFLELVLIPRMVFSRVVVRKVGGGDIGDGFGVDTDDLGGNQTSRREQRRGLRTFRASCSAGDGFFNRSGCAAMFAHERGSSRSLWSQCDAMAGRQRIIYFYTGKYFFGGLPTLVGRRTVRWPMRDKQKAIISRAERS